MFPDPCRGYLRKHVGVAGLVALPVLGNASPPCSPPGPSRSGAG